MISETEDATVQPTTAFTTQKQSLVYAEVAEDEKGVVFVFSASASTFCSGALVAPNLILTALHCVTRTQTEGFRCSRTGELTQIEPQSGLFGAQHEASSIEIYGDLHVEFPFENPIAKVTRIFGTGATHMCENDLTFLLLDTDLDLPIFPLRLERETTLGEPVTALGYGSTEDFMPFTRRIRDDLVVTGVGAKSAADPALTAPPRTVTVGRGPCQGDSGGPLLSTPSGAIIGPFSVITPADDCTSPNTVATYTRLQDFTSLVNEAFEAAGHEPWLEGEPFAPHLAPLDAGAGTVTPSTDGSVDSEAPDDDDEEPPGRRLSTGCAVSAAGLGSFRTALALTGLLLLILCTWRRRHSLTS